MQKHSTGFVDKVSYILFWVSVAVALVAGILAVASYMRYHDNALNRGNIGTFVRFAIFAVLLFVYRKIFVPKR